MFFSFFFCGARSKAISRVILLIEEVIEIESLLTIDIDFLLINTPNIHEFKLGFGGFGPCYLRLRFDDLRDDLWLEFD